MISKKLKAITLVETIIYLVLFGIIFTTIFQFVFTIQDGNKKSLSMDILEKNRIFISQHLQDSFTNSTEIDDTLSTFENDRGVLRLNHDAGYKLYNINDDRLQYSENGVNNYITPANTTLTRFYLTPLTEVDGTIVAIEISLTIETNTEYPDTVTLDSLYTIK